jgi:hypothetical protein
MNSFRSTLFTLAIFVVELVHREEHCTGNKHALHRISSKLLERFRSGLSAAVIRGLATKWSIHPSLEVIGPRVKDREWLCDPSGIDRISVCFSRSRKEPPRMPIGHTPSLNCRVGLRTSFAHPSDWITLPRGPRCRGSLIRQHATQIHYCGCGPEQLRLTWQAI